jgi:hypothetical protein
MHPSQLAALKRTARECADLAVCQKHVDPAYLDQMSTDDLRLVYRKIQSDSPMTMPEFNRAVRDVLTRWDMANRGHEARVVPPLGFLPIQWVKAALTVCTPCRKCDGTGVYTDGDANVSGQCYACNGKGDQHHDDWVRNANYWKVFRAQCAKAVVS